MQKGGICLLAALVFVVGIAGVSSAAPWGEIWYGGYVDVVTPTTVDPGTGQIIFGTVSADTGIFVFNPNGRPAVKCKITVFDKKGTNLWSGYLYDGLLSGNPQPKALIPPHGWNWITLGMIPLPVTDLATKYTFRLAFYKGPTPPKAPVVEIKEVIYDVPQGSGVSPVDIFQPDSIRDWSETSLGGPTGTGYY